MILDANLIYMQNSINIVNVIRVIFMVILSYYSNYKIKNEEIVINKKFIVKIILIILMVTICEIIKYQINYIISMLILTLFIALIFSKDNIGKSILITMISLSVNYIISVVTIVFCYFFNKIIEINNDYINLIIMMIFHICILKRILSIKKIKYGISFLQSNGQNDYVDILILDISIVILFSIVVIANSNVKMAMNIGIGFIVFSIVMFITIQKSLQLYYKQKMLIKELDETKEDLARAENKIKILEKENIEESKKRHTIIHKQKSIEYKLEEMLTKTEMSTEEVAEVRERLEKLNKEVYTEKEVMELDKTGINSIDDMLKYMQSECVKNKIDFTLQIKGNIHYMVHNLVKEEELETLLADHIKDAIIAINHTDNANRSILVRLGNIDDIYSLYIYDSGVEFKPEVLESLGKKPCTTYASEGGTGMGFMNTFDTVRKHKASLIIEEIGKPVKDNYTKVIIIKFDKKNEFRVKSYHEIEKV